MKITPQLFEAHLKCPTKCWLRSTREQTAGNAYAEWVQTENESYRANAARQLMADVPADECARLFGSSRREEAHYSAENLKTAKWRLAPDVLVRTPESEPRSSRGNEAQTAAAEPSPLNSQPVSQSLLTSTATNQTTQPEWTIECHLHALERIPSEGRGKPAQFIPIRFIFTNKLGKDDKLLLAFDAYVLSEVLGREGRLGKIIHGDDHATLKVKTSALAGEVRKRLGKIAALLSSPAPPDLVLNRHCAECEFQARCRQIAVEKDDLSLLANMSAKERQKLRSKGIFTVTQLSYTFRPRRRPKRLRDKREKYQHSLKALAIREKKIHIVGSPELKIEGTPVYLDVEGLPDRDFYYLIGVRIGDGESAVQHSLWADTVEDEGKIWREFLGILETIEKPVLIHYGSYETTFFEEMCERHGKPTEGSESARTIESAVNLISVLFAQIYFPTYANGLKDVADYLGFKWSEAEPSGLKTLMWRSTWKEANAPHFREKLLAYNSEDCQALEILVRATLELGPSQTSDKLIGSCPANIVHADSIPRATMWGKFSTPISEFEQINKAARWDYQRDRVYVRSSKRIRQISKKTQPDPRRRLRVQKVIECPENPVCPTCGFVGRLRPKPRTRVLNDLVFSTSGIRGRLVEYRFRCYWCSTCKSQFGRPLEFWSGSKFGSKYGTNLVALLLYESIDLGIHQRTVARRASRLYGLNLAPCLVPRFKREAAEFYKETREMILERIRRGSLAHVDETRANVLGQLGYVWVFASLHEVAYLYSDSREGEIAQLTLAGFNGVLVSDFFSAYDSFECTQQKCLIHLIRDLNTEVLDHPYDEELKRMVKGFGELTKRIIDTVDKRGLKRHFLQKHQRDVDRFHRKLIDVECHSEAAAKCKDRFQRNRDKLFAFLHHDGVPWNNNNAEHAIKAFAELRDLMRGSSTPNGIDAYLILLSICQTCKYMGVDFLDFLRSGEKDIHVFAESRRGRRRRTQTSQPTGLLLDAILDGAVSRDTRARGSSPLPTLQPWSRSSARSG